MKQQRYKYTGSCRVGEYIYRLVSSNHSSWSSCPRLDLSRSSLLPTHTYGNQINSVVYCGLKIIYLTISTTQFGPMKQRFSWNHTSDFVAENVIQDQRQSPRQNTQLRSMYGRELVGKAPQTSAYFKGEWMHHCT